jgi:alcohol oxidase
MTKPLVTRVLFDGTKAAGVEVIGNKNQDPDADQTPQKIIARKLVVISAGALGSPLILQRSGIGEVGRLEKLGVDVVADLPGVGANYEDHSSCLVPYHAPDSDATDTIDSIMVQEPGVMEPYLVQFANGKGFLTTNLIGADSKLRPTLEELKEMGPAFNEVWKPAYSTALLVGEKAAILIAEELGLGLGLG